MAAPPRRAVFLDRDGVINETFVRGGKPYPPATLGELRVLPGVAEAVRALSDADLLIVVVTNQPEVGAGRQTRETVEAMHARLRQRLLIDDVRVCYHTDADGCACRKPKPGMLLAAAADLGIALAESFCVGDRWRDVEAGQAVGCFSIFVDRGYGERRPPRPDAVVADLAEASAVILERLRNRRQTEQGRICTA